MASVKSRYNLLKVRLNFMASNKVLPHLYPCNTASKFDFHTYKQYCVQRKQKLNIGYGPRRHHWLIQDICMYVEELKERRF